MLKSVALGALLMTSTNAAQAQSPGFGAPVTAAELAAWDISIAPSGAGLPPGRGTVKQGETLFVAKCQMCHGEKGVGRPNDPLVGVLAGGIGSLEPGKPALRTVGSYWPYATTLFDYIRRAMPFTNPKTLSAEETYALSAYILHLSNIIGEGETMDAATLAKVKMPNRDGFIPFPRNPKP
jgi:cytochrome c